MAYENLKISIEGKIATVTLSRPQALNALNTALMTEISQVVDEINANDDIRVVILTGEGRSFVAGADIGEMSTLNAEQGRNWGLFGAGTFRKIETSPKIFIAAVNGFALGGGCELAMSCDLRVASEKAKFGQPEVGLGIIPGYSGTLRLPRIVGVAKAKELIYTSNIIDGTEAYNIGLVNYVTTPEDLMPKCIELANNILKNSFAAVTFAKQSINEGLQVDMDSAIRIEGTYFGLCFADPDQKEGMGAFLEKRKPNFK